MTNNEKMIWAAAYVQGMQRVLNPLPGQNGCSTYAKEKAAIGLALENACHAVSYFRDAKHLAHDIAGGDSKIYKRYRDMLDT